MRYIVIVVSICFVVSTASMVYAEQQFDHWCMNQCVGTPEKCHSICALTDSSGNPTENTECVSSCLKKGWTRYNCYFECTGEKGATEKPGSSN
jgi:hypothetical protein